jgi:hypothetical protein
LSRGAKKGDNRFKHHLKVDFRERRLIEDVKPVMITLSKHAHISSQNKFCEQASFEFNKDLPANEKKISARTISANQKYWAVLGPIYEKYFKGNNDLEAFKKQTSVSVLQCRIAELEQQCERLSLEKQALTNMLGSDIQPATGSNELSASFEAIQVDLDKLCKVISVLISISGIIQVDLESKTLRNLADDLESIEGMLPRDFVRPYVDWLIERKAKVGG